MCPHMDRDVLEALGGIPAVPLMEDCEFMWRAQRYFDIESSGPGEPTDSKRWRGKGIHALDNSSWNDVYYWGHLNGFMSETLIHQMYYPGREVPKCYPLGSKELIKN